MADPTVPHPTAMHARLAAAEAVCDQLVRLRAAGTPGARDLPHVGPLLDAWLDLKPYQPQEDVRAE